MGKFRKRVACKGKRWAKGQSSSSNPEAKTFRNAAKSRFFQVNLGNSGLTEFAVRKHEVMFGSVKAKSKSLGTEMDDVDDESVAGTSVPGTYKTFETFASDWSSCSNVSFSKLLTTFSHNSSIHKEMLAILAAVTEVIKEKNGTENSTEYFAALMTLLEGAADGDDYKEESVSAMLSLLSMGIKTVPRPVLQLKFADASKILMILLSKHAASNNNVIMRSLIGCLSVLLRAQDAVVWSQPSTMKVYESILSFCAHSKPKIRKAAQHACCAILKASACTTPITEPPSQSDDDFPSLQDSHPGGNVTTVSSSPHPASSVTAAYIIRNIELNPALGGSTSTLHVLGFLKDVIACLSKTNIKAVCESILKVMTLGNVIIISSGLETLHSLFLSSPDPTKTLTPQLNAQLINALYDYQPPSSDSQPTQAWLTTLGAAFGNLACVDLGLCMSNLTRFMTICTQLWMSDKMEVANGATHTLQGLLEDCVAKAASTSQSTNQHRISLKKVFDLLSSGLSYQYNRVWNQVLAVLSLLFKVCGATCADFMAPCLTNLAELRDSHNFPCSNEVDYAIGAAVRSMGVEVVLKQIPYQLGNGPDSAADEIKRSWLLPILKANIVNASLDLFVDYFLPLATLCRKRSEECRLRNTSSSLAISYNLLQTQMWSLLPAFCHKPSDVSSFPKLAKVLGNVLTSYKDLRLTVMLALRRLMESNPQCPLMRKYAKNYLPILLNIYTTPPRGTDDENVRTATFQTLEMYATRADREILAELLTSAVNKIKKAVDEQPSKPNKKSKKKVLAVEEEKQDEEIKSKQVKFLKASILDVIRVLLPYQHVQDIEELFSFLQETLNTSKDSTEVKKVYRILQELCESDQEGAQTFVKEHMEDIVDILVEPKDSKVATPSHAARLKCLSALLPSMTEPQTVNIIPPAVAGIKSVNSACRDTAFTLLTCVADRLVELNPQSGLTSLIDNLSVGLQGVPKLASASILGLASVTHHCRNSLVGTESLSTVISNILVLLTSNTREIVSSCLSFIKLLLTSFHKDDNAPHIPPIVREISAMSHDCKRHFRIKVKDIFVRLLRKYGDDTIFHMIPSHDVAIVKQVKNMIKIRRRKNKEKTKNSESDNEEEEFSVKSKPKTITEILEEIEKDDDQELLGIDEPKEKGNKKKQKKAKQFIQENEDEILDFTDMTNMGKISSSKPGTSQGTGVTGKKPKKDAFKMSEDGRLIITESDSEDETDKKLNKMGKLKIEDEDEDEEDKEDPRRILAGGKRKRGASEKGSVRSEPASKYQAGGSGIHRPINSSASSVKSFGSKSTKSNANVVSTDVGSVYKSKKSQGDMKRKGLPDPYAYVPLTRKLLNKRKKNKSTGQFKNIVKGAKKGAKIGKSLKSKDKKKGKK